MKKNTLPQTTDESYARLRIIDSPLHKLLHKKDTGRADNQAGSTESASGGGIREKRE
jgi:hypothetical protein